MQLYRNEGSANHWLVRKLEGTVSNRSAIGAKAWVFAQINERHLSLLRKIQERGSDPRVHFGLGDAPVINTLRIEWPSGIVQELHNVAAEPLLTITEEASGEG